MTLPSLIKTLKVGQLLMVETQTEILLGNLKFIDSNFQVIELHPVRDFKTNFVYTSAQILPLPLIKTIKIIHSSEEEYESTSTPQSTNNSGNDYSPVSTSLSDPAECHNEFSPSETPVCSNISLSSRELQLLEDQLSNTVYIFQTDQSYHKALADIKSQAVISLLLDPMEYGRHNRTSLMVVGTHRAVYIFDILMLGKIFREIKEILESKRPRKALHYSHRLCDNLKHRQNLTLAGVFDTFVAHCLLTGSKAHLNLIETIQYYFNISPFYFSEDIQTELKSEKETMDPYSRPIAKQHLRLLAKKAILQNKLYEHLLHEQMLANFYQQCEAFSNAFSSNTDTVEVALQMKPQSRYGFQNIRVNQEWKEFLDKEL